MAIDDFNSGGNPAMEQASYPGGDGNTSSSSMPQNQGKLRPDGPLGSDTIIYNIDRTLRAL